jgi:hypothetical protein
MASTYLTRTFSSPTDRKIFTWSAWVKRQNQVTDYQNALFGAYLNSSVRSVFRFNAHQLNFQDTEGSVEIKTNRLFRDVNAWYHIVLSVDTTQATASNRVKIYVNGVQETSFYQGNYPAQNSVLLMGGADIHYINARNSSGSVDSIADMSYSHIHFTDGTAYDATAFGETDATTGEWKIKTDVSVTYGNNGFFILKDGNSVTDQSGNSNNWTVAGGTLTKTEDNPSNVFATLNPLNFTGIGSTSLNYGNTEFRDGGTTVNFSYASGTIGANSGKYYWETKVTDLAEIDQVGVALASSNFSNISSSDGLQATTFGGKGFQFSNGYKVGDGTGSTYMGAFSTNDIAMIALDLDNNKITFGRNGQWSNGSGSCNQTYENSTPAFTNLTAGEYYIPAQAKRAYGSNYGTNNYNFGNGYFGTTAVSSAGTNASGNGIFEYDVPTGYTALSTKGLNL